MGPNSSDFAGWLALQERLDDKQCLEVVLARGKTWFSKFQCQRAASEDEISALKSALGVSVSEAYVSFLRLNNGCRLFVDAEHGQWGYLLYSSDSLVSKRALWRSTYPEWPDNYLVFGECIGDSDLLVMDVEQQSYDGNDCVVLCFPHAYFLERETMSSTFITWLDHLIVAQGAKYWQWT
jgi:hypothetical protein